MYYDNIYSSINCKKYTYLILGKQMHIKTGGRRKASSCCFIYRIYNICGYADYYSSAAERRLASSITFVATGAGASS